MRSTFGSVIVRTGGSRLCAEVYPRRHGHRRPQLPTGRSVAPSKVPGCRAASAPRRCAPVVRFGLPPNGPAPSSCRSGRHGGGADGVKTDAGVSTGRLHRQWPDVWIPHGGGRRRTPRSTPPGRLCPQFRPTVCRHVRWSAGCRQRGSWNQSWNQLRDTVAGIDIDSPERRSAVGVSGAATADVPGAVHPVRRRRALHSQRLDHARPDAGGDPRDELPLQ